MFSGGKVFPDGNQLVSRSGGCLRSDHPSIPLLILHVCGNPQQVGCFDNLCDVGSFLLKFHQDIYKRVEVTRMKASPKKLEKITWFIDCTVWALFWLFLVLINAFHFNAVLVLKIAVGSFFGFLMFGGFSLFFICIGMDMVNDHHRLPGPKIHHRSFLPYAFCIHAILPPAFFAYSIFLR